MSQHQAFRRAAIPPQQAQRLQTVMIPAPTRGIIQSENEAFMQPGAAVVCDNWKPTMRGVSLRGGCALWLQLPETTPVISAFSYASGNANRKMFAANASKLYDVTTTTPVLVKSGQTSGNYAASQMANAGGDWLLAVNETGDFPLRFNGTTWATLNGTAPAAWANNVAYAVGARAMDADRSYWKNTVAHTSALTGTFTADRAANPTYWVLDVASDGVPWILGPAGSNVVNGANLTYVCKYRNRWFFVEASSMNAWYLPLNAAGGMLSMIPLSGAATKGGKLLFCATWSIDAGDGIDDKLVFCTDLGELLIFTGGNPASATDWRQEGRYETSPPMGMNAHIAVGGDLLIATVDGVLPTSGAITKDRAELELAAVTRNIKSMWRDEVIAKRSWAWTMCKWDEYGGVFTTFPGGVPGKRYCLVTNAATGAHARFVGWDATCFIRMSGDMFFGTQSGQIMQADRTGFDNGVSYTAVLVGGWGMFQSQGQTATWLQARASYAGLSVNLPPQLSAVTDYIINLVPPPSAGIDPGVLDLWDQGQWDVAKWDASNPLAGMTRSTGWVSIGSTGYTHAPVVQITVGQAAKPELDLIAIAATYTQLGINV